MEHSLSFLLLGLPALGYYHYFLEQKGKQINFRDSFVRFSLLNQKDLAIYSSILQTEYLTEAEWAKLLHTKVSQIRAIKSSEAAPTTRQKDDIVGIAAILEHGLNTFGTKEALKSYLSGSPESYAGLKPFDLLGSSQGRTFIDDELGRIDHGVF